MDTPIYDFVQQYRAQSAMRLHMPGHKGQGLLGCEGLDITEIEGADNLFAPCEGGIIAQSEENARSLFGTAQTHYSAAGASACIGAMLYLAKLTAPTGRQGVFAARNAHKAFVQACALLRIAPHWLYAKAEDAQGLCGCVITPEALEEALCAAQTHPKTLPIAVYITSPDYLGTLADVAALAAVCARYDTPLLVDNAHGAYLKFLPKSQHPIDLGAAMCCDSAHKTLPVLTGGAYLHIAKAKEAHGGVQTGNAGTQTDNANIETGNAPRQGGVCGNAVKAACGILPRDAKTALSLFSSTSPSYLILQSLDVCNATLAGGYAAQLAACVQRCNALKSALAAQGVAVCEGEPLKLVLDCRAMGVAPCAVAQVLREAHIEPEFVDAEYLILMLSPAHTGAQMQFLQEVLCEALHAQAGAASLPPAPPMPTQHRVAMPLHEALFARGEVCTPTQAVGRICRVASVSCPPAVPIVVSGEVITAADAALFDYYGIEAVEVVAKHDAK